MIDSPRFKGLAQKVVLPWVIPYLKAWRGQDGGVCESDAGRGGGGGAFGRGELVDDGRFWRPAMISNPTYL